MDNVKESNTISEITIGFNPPLRPESKWGHGYNGLGHPQLMLLLNKQSAEYSERLSQFAKFIDTLQQIPVHSPESDELVPHFDNFFFPPMDSISLYCMLAVNKPAKFIEIGSGFSTKFARKAIQDCHLNTELISIDPQPRTEIDKICDKIIRKPLEDVSDEILKDIKSGDFLFYDGSHRSFMNSDVTVFFLDILPNLPKGVFVQIHDIFLPYDYPEAWKTWMYNEQYLLAAFLLAGGNKFKILLPNAYITSKNEIKSKISPISEKIGIPLEKIHGGSFWLSTSD